MRPIWIVAIIVALIGIIYLLNEENKLLDSQCYLLFNYRYDNFNWEKDYNDGKYISWEENKDFNKLCGKRVNYYFPENLEERDKRR